MLYARLIGEAVERYCLGRDDKRCMWVANIVDRTLDPQHEIRVEFSNLADEDLFLRCEGSSENYLCEIGRKKNYIFGGAEAMWGCASGTGGGFDDSAHLDDLAVFEISKDAVEWEISKDITEEDYSVEDYSVKDEQLDIQEVTIKDELSDMPKTDEIQQPVKKEHVVVAITDYVEGAVLLFGNGFPKSAEKKLGKDIIGSDLALRGFGSTLAVINRYGEDKVHLFAAGQVFPMLANFSTGTGSNPQDALLLGGLLYITVYATKDYEGNPIKISGNPIKDILIFDLANGSIKSRIDLTPYSKNDQPNATMMIEAGGKIYTIFQDLKGFTPDTNGKVAVIDPALNEVTAKIDLSCYNPHDMVYAENQGKLFIACAGDFMTTNETNAGIEVFDVMNQKSLGILIGEDAIGNNATKVRIVSDDLGLVATSNFNSSDISFIASFNPKTGKIIDKKLYGNETSNIADILVDKDGVLWIADRDAAGSGVVCIDPATGGILDSMTTLPMPPTSLATVEIEE